MYMYACVYFVIVVLNLKIHKLTRCRSLILSFKDFYLLFCITNADILIYICFNLFKINAFVFCFGNMYTFLKKFYLKKRANLII